jgi:hypothetical protein
MRVLRAAKSIGLVRGAGSEFLNSIEHSPYLAGELIKGEWFRKEVHPWVEAPMMDDGVARVSCGEQHF